MSAYDRLPRDYRAVCEQIGWRSGLSPQNRRVRQEADSYFADKRQAARRRPK